MELATYNVTKASIDFKVEILKFLLVFSRCFISVRSIFFFFCNMRYFVSNFLRITLSYVLPVTGLFNSLFFFLEIQEVFHILLLYKE